MAESGILPFSIPRAEKHSILGILMPVSGNRTKLNTVCSMYIVHLVKYNVHVGARIAFHNSGSDFVS